MPVGAFFGGGWGSYTGDPLKRFYGAPRGLGVDLSKSKVNILV